MAIQWTIMHETETFALVISIWIVCCTLEGICVGVAESKIYFIAVICVIISKETV